MTDRPDTVVRRWIERHVGQLIVRADALVGGLSSDVWRCHLEDGTTVVVRHIVDVAWLAREPGLIDQERTALGVLADTPVAAPRFIAGDAARGLLVMSDLGGEVRAERAFVAAHAEELAAVAAFVAAVELPPRGGLSRWRAWGPPDPTPPSWGDGALWAEAIARVAAEPMPEGPTGLLHRDLHPLNVVWDGARLSGVVDWVNACVGHPHAELGHCRWNLAVLVGLDAADRFLARYLELTNSGPFDRWWDLVDVLSFLPGPIGTSAWHAVGRTDLTDAVVIERTETFIRAAL